MAISVDAHVKVLTNVGDPLLSQDGTPIVGTRITFQLVQFGTTKSTSAMDAVTGETITKTPTTVLTDINGEFTVNLWPNNRGDSATAYMVTFSKNVNKFYILVDGSLGTSLLIAKAAYTVGTGAVSADALAVALTGYAKAPTALTIVKTGTWRYEPTLIVQAPGASQLVSSATINPLGNWVQDFLYNEAAVAVGKELTSLSFTNLTGVAANFDIQSCNLITAITLPELKDVGGTFQCSSMPLLSSLLLPKLETAGAFNLVTPNILTLDLPKITAISNTLSITAVGITTLNIPLLKSVGTLILNAAQLTSATFTNLKTVNGSIVLQNLTSLTTLTFPVLDICGSMTSNSNCGSLTLISMPVTTVVMGSLALNGLTNATTISLPNVQTILGNITSSATNGVTTVNLGTNLKTLGGTVTISTGGALTQSTVDHILSVLATLDGTNGTTAFSSKIVTIKGGSAAPSAAGLASKATLVARGCTVTHN